MPAEVPLPLTNIEISDTLHFVASLAIFGQPQGYLFAYRIAGPDQIETRQLLSHDVAKHGTTALLLEGEQVMGFSTSELAQFLHFQILLGLIIKHNNNLAEAMKEFKQYTERLSMELAKTIPLNGPLPHPERLPILVDSLPSQRGLQQVWQMYMNDHQSLALLQHAVQAVVSTGRSQYRVCTGSAGSWGGDMRPTFQFEDLLFL